MTIKEWSTGYTGANPVQDADPVTGVMPDLTDESAPGAGDGDETRTSQVEQPRDKLQAVCKMVGDSATPPAPAGSLAEILDRDHANGDALQVRLRERAADPTNVANKGFIYTKDDTGVTQLFYIDSAGTVYQLTPSSGGGFTAYEKEYTAAAGANEFDLTVSPAVNANTLSGRNILGVFRNGVRSRYQATATLANEYDQTGGTDKINVVGQSGGEIFTVVFGV